MKFSINWMASMAGGLDRLRPSEIGNLITLKTAELDGIVQVGAHFTEVCAARVVSVDDIPGSHNRKAVVETGRYGTRTVVCGAPNCRPGLVTAYVPSGCTLGTKAIRTAVIGGVESDGMLASGAELGLNRDTAGILELSGCEPGDPIPGCAPDSILEIDNKSLTHRPDLWGHYGMAREVAAILRQPLRDPVDLTLLPVAGGGAVKVSIEEFDLCSRYSALVLENVTVGPSPLWLQYRLEAVGLNPINNVVDVTNYVMAELAQPMHAFDLDTLAGAAIQVRRARAGETITALNEQTYALDEQALIIADAGQPIAVAGVIGGLETGVTVKTSRIVLESACFHPASVRKTAARYKCRTDASMRFEKSQDPSNTVRGLARALALLREVSPGIRLAGGLVDACGPLPPPPVIDLPLDWLRRKLGRPVEPEEVRAILEALQFGVAAGSAGTLRVTVPSWRATKDISIKDDLLEEVGRMLGYSEIAPVAPRIPSEPPPPNPERTFLHRVREWCVAQGFTEVYNYSFVSEDQAAELGLEPGDHVAVANPIASDQGLLRTTLLTGILRNVRDNARHFGEFRLFEIGHEIHRRTDSLPDEIPHLAAAVYGRDGDGVAGMMEVKRLAECLLPGIRVTPAQARPFEHPHRAWTVNWRETPVGRIGEFHPRLVEGRAAFLDLDLREIRNLGGVAIKHQPLRRFPTSAFDLSVVTPVRTLVGEIEDQLRSNGGTMVQSVEFVRQYTGAPLAGGFKSVSFRVTVGAPDRTLPAAEIASIRQRLIEALQALGYELRI